MSQTPTCDRLLPGTVTVPFGTLSRVGQGEEDLPLNVERPSQLWPDFCNARADAASFHVVSSIPFLLIHEFYPQNAGFNLPGVTRMAYELDKDGYIGLTPGRRGGREMSPGRIPQTTKLQLVRS